MLKGAQKHTSLKHEQHAAMSAMAFKEYTSPEKKFLKRTEYERRYEECNVYVLSPLPSNSLVPFVDKLLLAPIGDKAPIAIICLSLLSFLLPWCTYGNLLTSVSDRGTREWQRSDDRIGGMGWQLYLPVSWTVWRRVNVYTSNLSPGTITKWLAPMGCCHVMAAGLNWKNSKGEVCPLTHRGHCNIIAGTEKGEKKSGGFQKLHERSSRL